MIIVNVEMEPIIIYLEVILLKKLNNFLSLGLVFNAIWLLSKHFNLLPDFVEGFCLGIGIVLILMGMYAGNHDISKLRNFKKNLLYKTFRK